jgi:hypothetical protein
LPIYAGREPWAFTAMLLLALVIARAGGRSSNP